MTLQELLDIQKELNSHLEATPTNEQLCWAIMAELGEFAQSRKGDWCWWKRQGKEFSSESRERQLDELADVLCFLLTGALAEKEVSEDFSLSSGNWEGRFQKPVDDGQTLEEVLSDVFEYATEMLFRVFFRVSICRFATACQHLGFTQAEIETAYLKKVEVNKQRWETGGKESPPQMPYRDYPVSIRIKLPPGEYGIPLEIGHSAIAQITKHFTQEQWNSFPVLNQYQAIQDVARAAIRVANVSIQVEGNGTADKLE